MSKIKAGTTSTTAYQVEADTTGTLVLQTGATPTTAMTITSSQQVGIGTASPSAPLAIGRVNSAEEGGQLDLCRASDNASSWGIDVFGSTSTPSLRFIDNVASATRMAIDGSGNLLVGTTSSSIYRLQSVASASGNNAALLKAGPSGAPLDCWQPDTTGNNPFIQFYTEGSATLRGSITYNRGGGLVAYNTTSDYRAKTVNGAVQNALTKVAALKPSTGRMNGAEYDIDFFVAHELQEVVPSAVTGEKDAVKEDGTPNYQMVDKSALIPLLTAAIQEQQALITTLTERITALEGAQA